MTEALQEYAEGLIGEDEFLQSMRQEAARQRIPSIQVPIGLARLLSLLVVQSRARRILEIGTLFGYSTVVMGRALPANGELVSLEAEPRHAALARENVVRAGLAGKVQIIEGKALETLARLDGGPFDLVFIDADKDTYPRYLDWALRLTRPGSTIVADNVWRGGALLDPDGDAAAQAMRQFNEAVFSDQRLLTVMIPRFDGSDAATVSVVL